MSSRYVAFLRGINQSGKNRIPMAELKRVFDSLGFSDIVTVLNSGNILFSAEDGEMQDMRQRVETGIRNTFGFEIPVCLMTLEHLRELRNQAPAWWGTDEPGIYHNLIFLLTDETPAEICAQLGEPSKDWEQVGIVQDVIFWSYDLKVYQKCNWWKKTAGRGICEKLTIRTGNTIRRICR